MLMNLHNSKYDMQNSLRFPFPLQPQMIVSANGHIETLWNDNMDSRVVVGLLGVILLFHHY